HGELAQLLRAPEPVVRQAVAKIISQVGSNTLFAALSQALREDGHPGRAEAMEALIGFANHLAIPSLAPVARSGSPADKQLALKHLGDARAMAKDAAGALQAIAPSLDDMNDA